MTNQLCIHPSVVVGRTLLNPEHEMRVALVAPGAMPLKFISKPAGNPENRQRRGRPWGTFANDLDEVTSRKFLSDFGQVTYRVTTLSFPPCPPMWPTLLAHPHAQKLSPFEPFTRRIARPCGP